jgi:hypothetical protein
MNTQRLAPRLFSFALAALVTGSMIAGIDTLARSERAANGLMAQAMQQADKPL